MSTPDAPWPGRAGSKRALVSSPGGLAQDGKDFRLQTLRLQELLDLEPGAWGPEPEAQATLLRSGCAGLGSLAPSQSECPLAPLLRAAGRGLLKAAELHSPASCQKLALRRRVGKGGPASARLPRPSRTFEECRAMRKRSD